MDRHQAVKPRHLAALGLAGLGLGVLAMSSTTTSSSPASDWRRRPVGRHFVLGEWVVWGTHRGPHREPPPEVVAQIERLVATILDPLREHLGRPVHVASGWRPADVYGALPNGRTSAHTIGAAADVYVGMTPGQLARAVDDLARRGVIAQGGVGVYPPGWRMESGEIRQKWDPTVHIDTGAHTRPGRRRWPLTWWRAA